MPFISNFFFFFLSPLLRNARKDIDEEIKEEEKIRKEKKRREKENRDSAWQYERERLSGHKEEDQN